MDVVQERDGASVVQASLIRDGNIGGILSRTTASGSFYYNYDGSGNVTQLTDSSQSIVAEYGYDAYGNATSSGSQASQPYGYSTKEKLGGLLFYGFRFYNPGLGRWINRDPIREAGGVNLYAMVANSPTNAIDSLGLSEDIGGGPNTIRLSLARFIPMSKMTISPTVLGQWGGPSSTYRGDARGYSCNSPRYRVEQNVRIDLQTGVSHVETIANPTHVIGGFGAGYVGQAVPNPLNTSVQRTGSGYQVTLSTSTGTPNYHGVAPTIRNNIEINLDNSGHIVSLWGTYSLFPALELWVYRNGSGCHQVLGHMPSKHGITPLYGINRMGTVHW